MNRVRTVLLLALVPIPAAQASCDPGAACGPARGVVERVVDGDTIVLAGGVRVRYLNVDTPESTPSAGQECFGPDASAYNAARVEGREVQLTYDARCVDRYGRLLAHVWENGTDVGLDEVARGYGCVLIVPPNDDGREAFEAAEQVARAHGRGLWGACRRPWPCGE